MRRLWIAAGVVWLGAALFAATADTPLGFARWTWGPSPALGLMAYAVTAIWVLPLAGSRRATQIEWKDLTAESAALATPLVVWLAAATHTSPVAWGSALYAALLLALAGAWSRRLTASWRPQDRRWNAWLAATWAVGVALPIGAMIAREYWKLSLDGFAALSPLWLALEAGRANLPSDVLAHGLAPAVVVIVGFALLLNRERAGAAT